MENIEKLVRERRSVRSYDGRELSGEDRERLCAFIETLDNPFGIPVEYKLLEKMGCPVVVGTDLYISGKMKDVPHMNEAFGYSFEKLVLYAQSLGIGTVWIGGTMNRDNFEKAAGVSDGEVMPCISPLGYPAAKMSLRESMMRKAIKADDRLPFEEIVFAENFDTPLKKEDSDKLFLPLEMVRLGPSAVNKQPWRMVVSDGVVHFYLKRSKKFSGGKVDMQKIDVGIALCHFELTAKDIGVDVEFLIDNPNIPTDESTEYIASYKYKV